MRLAKCLMGRTARGLCNATGVPQRLMVDTKGMWRVACVSRCLQVDTVWGNHPCKVDKMSDRYSPLTHSHSHFQAGGEEHSDPATLIHAEHRLSLECW